MGSQEPKHMYVFSERILVRLKPFVDYPAHLTQNKKLLYDTKTMTLTVSRVKEFHRLHVLASDDKSRGPKYTKTPKISSSSEKQNQNLILNTRINL